MRKNKTKNKKVTSNNLTNMHKQNNNNVMLIITNVKAYDDHFKSI
jgi:hypothetical protein